MSALAARLRHHRSGLSIALMLAVLALGLVALHHVTGEVRMADLRAAWQAIEAPHVLLCVGLTATSYFALSLYDHIALRVIGRPLPWRTAALASFTSYTLSHNLGLGWLTGGSARYRIYTAAGLDGPDVARIVAIASAMFWMGVVLIAGTAFLVHGGPLAIGDWSLPQELARIVGLGILALGAVLFLLCATGPRELRVMRWTLPLPNGRQALAQYAIAALDITAASAALFVLVPGADPALLPAFVLAYSIAVVAALLSHVPGGVGVFEAVLIALLPGEKSTLFAALILYRLIYYILPLALGVMLLAAHEGARWRGPAARALSSLRLLASSIAPLAMAVASLAGGSILLLSGSLPAIRWRLRALESFVPLPFVEASHIAASSVGTLLLLLAPGLLRRLDGAFVAARALLLAGALFALVRGIDYEEAAVCLAIAALLQWTHPAFYRRTALTAEPLSTRWIAVALALVAVAAWIGLFVFKDVAYRDELWWQFAMDANAPRYMRATLAAFMIVAAVAVWRSLLPSRPAASAFVTDVESIRPALRAARHTDAMLALTRDKRFLLSATGDAFLMFQVKGASWLVMGDPVGPRERWPELVWRIRDLADAAQGRLVLYQISREMLELAVDLGLQVIKYGEEALVRLDGFSLDGGSMRSLRQADRRAEREGLTLEIVPAAGLDALWPDLEAISADWLAAKDQHEKGFSLGRFDRTYLAEFDIAVVRRDGIPVAFANIWATAGREELSVDLMRHADDAPSGTMDFLFVRLMRWGQAQGFATFSLGLAPLSGITSRRLAPAWARIATLLFNHGERFYGFRGLRDYKAKFHPDWQPRYIAGPHGLAILPALVDLNALIGGAASGGSGEPSGQLSGAPALRRFTLAARARER